MRYCSAPKTELRKQRKRKETKEPKKSQEKKSLRETAEVNICSSPSWAQSTSQEAFSQSSKHTRRAEN